MVKIDLPGVNTTRKRTKQGWRYYYYHRASKERLPDDPASPEFVARLQELNDQYKQPETRKIIPGSFAALIAAYKESRDFRSLKPRSRVSYTRYLSVIEENWGRNKVSAITREAVFNLRDAYEDTPRTANFVIQVLRLLLNYALDRPSVYGLSFNPAVRPKKLKTGEGYRPWEDHEIAAFRAKWAPDTLQRVAFEIMLNTGQRRGDVVRMARNQYRKGWVSLTQEKTGRKLEIPASQDLVAVLEPWLTAHEHLVILTNQNKLKGKALTDRHFSTIMREAYTDAGLPTDCTSHGLRYTAATVLHELGCDWETISAVTGHETRQMVQKYSQQKIRASAAISRLEQKKFANPE